ncbi:MAG: serine O-acetyltransferase [Proteobacteria bacterium]|nr:serine O-acetyltransferase [Cystobacterineae bacterium]MCL2258224.1 serine O-acetyltransferase [Cystobacterineae bacterium]MCL2315432.1 serine O-acetyltransferase [Pseudomonadota bacterium]
MTFHPPLVEQLFAAHSAHCFPSKIQPLVQQFASQTMGLLFPHFSTFTSCSKAALEEELLSLLQLLGKLTRAVCPPGAPTREPSFPERFSQELWLLHESMQADAQAIFEGDPAAQSLDEVILTYPGFYAIALYRLAHALHLHNMPLVPRMLTEFAHWKTGIDIHPAARIGNRFFIDHGTGIVIGGTTYIGNNVKLYQGVTLGALTVAKHMANQKRHPTLEDGVVVYANATILGGSTVIGENSIVAGNAFITRSIPPNSLAVRQSEIHPNSELPRP